MSERTHYIIIGNKRFGYTLQPARKVTTIICKSADIEARVPNDEIPRILAELPRILIERYSVVTQEPQTEVLRFRVTNAEKEAIIHNARAAGYDSVSAYLRDCALTQRDEDAT